MLNFKFIFLLFVVVFVTSSLECRGGTDVCSRPLVDPGYCRASFRRYGFNGEKCTEFTWGGCDDNGNNFETLEQCQAKCETKTKG